MRTLHINAMTPAALAVAVTLHEKSLAFEVAAHAWQDTPDALAAFPQIELRYGLEGEYPLLVDDGEAVADSWFVLEYLDDKYPDPPLRPGDAWRQWQMPAFARFLGERVAPAVSTLTLAAGFDTNAVSDSVRDAFAAAPTLSEARRAVWSQALAGPPSEALITESRRKLRLFYERVETMLHDSGGPWLLGDGWSLADIAAFAVCWPFLAGGIDAGTPSPNEAMRAWFEAVASRPAVAVALALRPITYLPGPEHARWG